ncbi:MAG: hypothetical protein JSR60_13490 [Proteobacteria bacterium]|nr:hypothetical protein [Pseudomonadota bacterium]
MKKGAVLACALTLTSTAAHGGAWTLTHGHWQSFSSTTLSSASLSFDAHGRASIATTFNKTLSQNTFEYGLTNAITLLATPAFVSARVSTPTVPHTVANNLSIEAGVRLSLYAAHGRLSLQGSYKTAGAFDFSVSANRASGRQIELRLLYGTSFKLFGRDGFADFQVAQRWIDHPRPNETPFDVTLGLWLTKRTMVMAQSFNIVSAGDAAAPYTFYRTHKLEFSVVRRVTRHWSIQLGAFYSPAGQNALVERGFSFSFWTQV